MVGVLRQLSRPGHSDTHAHIYWSFQYNTKLLLVFLPRHVLSNDTNEFSIMILIILVITYFLIVINFMQIQREKKKL